MTAVPAMEFSGENTLDKADPNAFIPLLYPARLRPLFVRNHVVFLPWLDLCEALAVFRGGRAVLVREADLKTADTDPPSLLRRAEANALTLLPPVVAPLADLLPEGVAREEDAGLYVITNSRSNRGASAVCCPGVLGEASELLGGDFYLLPSSIHEMIAVPAKLAGSGERLGGMVREINRTVLSEEEFLADTVYFYRAAEGRLVCAGAS